MEAGDDESPIVMTANEWLAGTLLLASAFAAGAAPLLAGVQEGSNREGEERERSKRKRAKRDGR